MILIISFWQKSNPSTSNGYPNSHYQHHRQRPSPDRPMQEEPTRSCKRPCSSATSNSYYEVRKNEDSDDDDRHFKRRRPMYELVAA